MQEVLRLKLSIVCVYNNQEILNDYLLKSVKMQKDVEYELLLVDNTKNKYESAAKALNVAGNQASGDYIIFVHQDIMFTSPNSLKSIESYLTSENKIFGVAGRKDSQGVITNITHGQDHRLAGSIQITKPVEVQTLDECLIIIPKNVFQKLKFDETVVDGWHLYAVEYCLSAKKLGIDPYVIPADDVYHLSSGFSMNDSYYKILRKVARQHREYELIYTTMGIWPTKSIKLNPYLVLIKTRRFLKNLLENF